MTSGVFEDFTDLEALEREASSSDPQRRRIAVLSAVDSGEPSALLLLRGLVGDTDPHVRRQVALALGTFDGAEAADGLVHLLRDDDPVVASAAAQSLAELKDTGAAASSSSARSTILGPSCAHRCCAVSRSCARRALGLPPSKRCKMTTHQCACRPWLSSAI